MNDTWDCTPKSQLYVGFANQKWNVPGAIAELVDNSLGKQRGNARLVEIIFNRTKDELEVFDDGSGMDHIGMLFQLGSTIGIGPQDIGKYGMGGTMALLWLGSSVSIWTLRDSKVMHDTVTWADYVRTNTYPKVSNVWESASLRNVPVRLWEAKHGTFIRIKLRPERSITPDYIQRELARLYSPGLRKGRKIKWLTYTRSRVYEQNLHAEQFDLPDEPGKICRFNLVVLTPKGDYWPVHGVVALVDGLPYKQSQISIGFEHRAITTTRDCYKASDDSRAYTGTGVAGWLDLGDGWQDSFTLNKDGISDERVWSTLMSHVFAKIEPLLKQTEEDRVTIELEGIALEITNALNGIGEVNFEADVEPAIEPVIVYPDFDGPDKPFKPFKPNPDIVETPGPREGSNEDDKPPLTRIKLIKQDDEAMSGGLCRFEIPNEFETNLNLEVNKEHPVITEILKARPIQKLALLLLATREIAAALCAKPNVMKRALPTSLLKALEPLSEAERERRLARLLMDSARRPQLDEAA